MSPGPEALTRKQLIDRNLRDAGWNPIVRHNEQPPRDVIAVEEYPTTNGPADYLLFSRGLPIAVVEAKKKEVPSENVLEQAQRYARGLVGDPLTFGEYGVPFAYSSNGQQIWFRDLRDKSSLSRQVQQFHTPTALQAMLAHDMAGATEWLRNQPVDHPWLRPYQKAAISSVESALLKNRRKMLLAMATGTGKTLTTIALLYRLIKSGYARRILFLVDRRALAAQAVTAFAAFEAEPGLKFNKIYDVFSQRIRREDLEDADFDPQVLPASYLTNPSDATSFVYVSTIQRLHMNLFGEPAGGWADGDQDDESDAVPLDIPIDAFDVIVADESHRGYTSSEEGKWRKVLDHFDAIKIGLTATPAVHTVAYFSEPVYSYGLDEGVRDGYLVDYDALTLDSKSTVSGTFLKPGDEVGLQDKTTGEIRYEKLEDERELPAVNIDREWASPDRDRKLVQELVEHWLQQEQELGHFPKTLIFAHNDNGVTSHAQRLVGLLREELGRGNDFVQKITGSADVDRPLQRIREFRNRPQPGVVVTVDMLSTGVDIPSLENIVLFRPVWSRIMFEQMLGRGTRLSPEINKTHFTVFDAFGVLKYFAGASDFTPPAPATPSRSTQQVIEDIYNNKDRDYNIKLLVRRLQRIEKNISGDGRDAFSAFIADGDIGGFARDLPDALKNRRAEMMRILRDPAFQDLMRTYPQTRQDFIIAESAVDYVSVERLIHVPGGKSVRPADYLREFGEFVRQNGDTISALRILFEQPAAWNTGSLSELRQKLAAQPNGYTEDRLRQAYHMQLADIISMVRHAARGEPLLSAQERVDRALEQVRADKSFTPEQERWLELIRNHLVENLAISPDDFKLINFTRRGATYRRVDQDFGGQLTNLLREINTAMAA